MMFKKLAAEGSATYHGFISFDIKTLMTRWNSNIAADDYRRRNEKQNKTKQKQHKKWIKQQKL